MNATSHALFSSPVSAPERLPLILDGTVCLDTALALCLALAHPRLELLGIGCSFGAISTLQSCRNALALCSLAGRRVPVCEGVNTPLRKAPVHPDPAIDGQDGLGNQPERLGADYGPDEHSAARFIVAQALARPGEVSVVVAGPLGNLCQALRLEPRLPELLRQVVVTGGTILAPGNVSPVAEASIWYDPHAADQLLTSGFKLKLVGLDVAEQALWPLAALETLAAAQPHRLWSVLQHAAAFKARGSAPAKAEPSVRGTLPLLAPLGLLALLAPEQLRWQRGRVRVATEGLAEGQTILDRRAELAYPQPGWEPRLPEIDVALGMVGRAAPDLLTSALAADWLH